METLLKANSQTNTIVARIEMQLSQLATLVGDREKGTLPSQPIHVVQDDQIHQINQVNAIISLRYGKKFDNHIDMLDHVIQTQKNSSSDLISPIHSSQSEEPESYEGPNPDSGPSTSPPIESA